MTKKNEEASKSRRDFLKLGAVAPAGVAALTAGTAVEASEPDLASDKMQDTAHTRAYLESTRF